MRLRQPISMLCLLAATAFAWTHVPPVRAAAAAEASARPLDDAKRLYEAAKFDDAITLLTRALHDGQVSGDDVVAARALRARCLVKAGRRLEAKEAFKAVLRVDRQFRLDPNEVPPDEMDTFRLAAQEIDSEQFEAGKRFPASIGFSIGRGSAVNQDLADLASSAGVEPADDFSEKVEFGYSVRFPLRPLVSIDFGVQSLTATTEDKLPAVRNAHAKYTAYAYPILVSLVRNYYTSPKRRLNAFIGAGPMLSEAYIVNNQTLVSGRLIPTEILGRKVGWYVQAGLEGEYLLQPRFALNLRLLARRANSGKLKWPRDDFEVYDSYDASILGDRAVDFSGVAASIGVRAYIGY